jgi:hypothetical protein
LAEPISPPAPAAHVGAVDNSNAHVGTAPAGNCAAHVGAVGAIGHSNHNAHVGAPAKLDAAIVRTQAKEALVGLGWKPAIANPAVAAAAAALGAEATLERLIFEALRRCSGS